MFYRPAFYQLVVHPKWRIWNSTAGTTTVQDDVLATVPRSEEVTHRRHDLSDCTHIPLVLVGYQSDVSPLFIDGCVRAMKRQNSFQLAPFSLPKIRAKPTGNMLALTVTPLHANIVYLPKFKWHASAMNKVCSSGTVFCKNEDIKNKPWRNREAWVLNPS